MCEALGETPVPLLLRNIILFICYIYFMTSTNILDVFPLREIPGESENDHTNTFQRSPDQERQEPHSPEHPVQAFGLLLHHKGCGWPTVTDVLAHVDQPLKALLVADPHLLGPRKGHWLDKWRREGQMQRAFRAIIDMHRPDVVFFLGDLFDEGLWSSDVQFRAYIERYRLIFRVPDTMAVYHVAGNHDIGFHHDMSPRKAKRFERQLNSSSVQLLTIKGNHIVLLNSMALEGDGCSLCREAVAKIEAISKTLLCVNGEIECTKHEKSVNFSRPILMQHFPLYRKSDAICTGPDAAPRPELTVPFRNRIDAISEQSTELLIDKLRPRAAFGGHTHHGCQVYRRFGADKRFGFDEYSVPSFSWRNRPAYVTTGPKYFLVKITPQDIGVSKCDLPRETTVAMTAVILLSMAVYCAIKADSIQRQCRKITSFKEFTARKYL